jgi:hypothetical protein
MEAPAEQEVAPASTTVKKEQKESARYRNVVSRSKAPLPKAILKRKKAQSYWSWAGPAAMVAAVLVALLAVLGYYQYYYLPANTSNWVDEARVLPPARPFDDVETNFAGEKKECMVCFWDVKDRRKVLFIFDVSLYIFRGA